MEGEELRFNHNRPKYSPLSVTAHSQPVLLYALKRKYSHSIFSCAAAAVMHSYSVIMEMNFSYLLRESHNVQVKQYRCAFVACLDSIAVGIRVHDL